MDHGQQTPIEPTSCVLLVEADPLVRNPVAEYLRQCGYKVVEATTTDEAVEILTKGNVPVDVALADARSPGRMDGFAFARWIREQNHRTSVILAGSAEKIAGEAGELCEDGPHLAKPYDHRLLLDRIKRELARRDRLTDAAGS